MNEAAFDKEPIKKVYFSHNINNKYSLFHISQNYEFHFHLLCVLWAFLLLTFCYCITVNAVSNCIFQKAKLSYFNAVNHQKTCPTCIRNTLTKESQQYNNGYQQHYYK